MRTIRITKKLLTEVVSETAGPDVVELALVLNKLKEGDNISEFKLAEDLDMEVNIVRNMLYRLLNNNFVAFTRKKDKRKGWYIYYWSPRKNEFRHGYKKLKKKKLQLLEKRLEREESNQFFVCDNTCMRVSFDHAILFNYRCTECGELLNIEDNNQKIKKIKSDIKEVKKFLSTYA